MGCGPEAPMSTPSLGGLGRVVVRSSGFLPGGYNGKGRMVARGWVPEVTGARERRAGGGGMVEGQVTGARPRVRGPSGGGAFLSSGVITIV